jgi:hypothetical protein
MFKLKKENFRKTFFFSSAYKIRKIVLIIIIIINSIAAIELGIQILSLIIFSFKKQGKVKPSFSLSDDKSFK